jgi:amino acid transporter
MRRAGHDRRGTTIRSKSTIGPLAQSGAPLAEAGTRIAGYWGGVFVTAGAVVSIGGCLNVSVLCAGQSAMAAALDVRWARQPKTLEAQPQQPLAPG